MFQVNDKFGVVPLGNCRVTYRTTDPLRRAPALAYGFAGHATAREFDRAAICLAAYRNDSCRGPGCWHGGIGEGGRERECGDQVPFCVHQRSPLLPDVGIRCQKRNIPKILTKVSRFSAIYTVCQGFSAIV